MNEAYGKPYDPLDRFSKLRSAPVPYERMSDLAKINHDAREMGMTYGQYVGYLHNGKMVHRQVQIVDGRKVIL